MIVDTSAWIEFLRPGPSVAGDALAAMIERGERIVVPETVILELLSGRTGELVAARRRRMLATFELAPGEPLSDGSRAAALQRECRRAGDTVRSLGDGLVAAVSLRLSLPVVHRDRDFEMLRAHCGLPTVSFL